MAVYGDMQGELDESVVLTGNGNWYGQAKMEAEEIFREYANEGGASTMFRIGCVYGACSVLWVDRIGLLIRRGRLGDLAQYADGWSNLVHVNDISRAVLARIKKPSQGFEIYNLSAPDSPRWNTYFRDFCIAMDCTPLRYKTRFSMLIESKIVAPPLKLLERLSRSGLVPAHRIHSIPPSLLRLWAQHIRLISSRIEKSLQLEWTPYSKGLSDSIEYFRSKYNNE
jgi:nucleoside-diphosphate-sugar epimerase